MGPSETEPSPRSVEKVRPQQFHLLVDLIGGQKSHR